MFVKYAFIGMSLLAVGIALALLVQRDRILKRLREQHPEVGRKLGAPEPFALLSVARGKEYVQFVSEREFEDLQDKHLEKMIAMERRLQLSLYGLLALGIAFWITQSIVQGL